MSAGGVAGAAAPSAGLEPSAAGAAEPAAPGAAACPAAPGVDVSEEAAGAAGAGGFAAWSVPADSCFAQAVNISAATIALRASLVFIDRYPEGSKSCVKKTTTACGRSRARSRAAERKFYRSPGTIGNRDDGVTVGAGRQLESPGTRGME